MALCRLTFIFVLQCIFVLNINCEGEFHETNDETYRPQIWCFLNYLNSNENRVYNYNYATLISAQNKDIDTTDLTIDIEVNCHQNSPKCITNVLQCSGTVQYNSEQAKYETLPSFECGPKVRIDLSRDDDFSEEAETRPREGEAPAEVDLTHEVATDGQTSGEQFIAVKPDSVYCLGCPVDLNTDVEGLHVLTDTALQHIESERSNKQAIVRVIRLQQQVVSGIKYILLLEIAPTTCPKTIDQNNCVLDANAITEICEIVYFQQPWISKSKRIISNNCTEAQEWGTDEATPPNSAANDLDNEIDVNYNYKKPAEYPDIVDTTIDTAPNYDSLADTGHADDILKMSGGIMDPSRMKDVESQVIYHAPEMTVEPESVLTDDQKDALEGLLGMMGDEPREKRSADDSSSSSSSSSEEDDKKKKDRHDDDDDDDNNDHKKKKNRHDDNDDDDDDNDHKKKHRHDDNDDDDDNDHKKKHRHDDDDDDDDNDVHNKEKYSKKKKYHKEQDKNEENNDTSSSSSSSSSEEDKREKRETTINEETNKNDSSSSSSSSEEQNNEDNRTKRDEPTTPKQASSESDESSEETKGTLRRKRNIRSNNHLIKVTPEERNFVSNLATFAVNTLDNIDADTQKRVVLQVLAAKKSQEPEGVLYHLTLRVGISRCEEEIEPEVNLTKINVKDEECKDNLMESLTKICKVQVQVNSEQENPKVIKSHCQNMKKDHVNADVNRTFRSKRGGVPGGVSDVDPDDPKMQQYAKDLLVQMDGQDGDGKTSELIKIISVTKQVVQGYRYKFNVELKIGGAPKKCLLDVWDQPWVKKDGKQVTVTCDKQPEQKYRFRRSHKDENMGDLQKTLVHDIKIVLFKAFAEQYNKTYATNTEMKKRFQIFRKNIKMIKTLNENEQGTATYGMTKFTDMTREEFTKYLGLRPELQNLNDIPYPNAQIPDIELPTEFDWRKKGAVSEVKNQGQCGSCWAFSVTGNIEGQNAIKTGKMIELSEQELVDCDKLDEGCNGGLPDNAYRAIEQLGGLETEKDYPYEAEDEKCHFNKSLTRVQISGAVNISSDETDMAKWLVQNGPISIGINANAMQFYMGGISHPWKFLCDPKTMDHGVLIVGYGVHKYPLFNKVLPYWIVKNSWGPTWGEQGYYRVYRGDGTCGVNQMASSAVL